MSLRARVLYDYDAKDTDQLSIKAGQLIEISGDATNEGWVLAKSKGKEGYVPAQYIEEVAGGGGAGGPPPKPPGARGGFNMPSARTSTGQGEKKKAPHLAAPANRNPPPSSGGRGAGNSVFGGDKESSTKPLQTDDAYSIFAYFMEWFGVVGMFLSGLFALMYGTIVVDPEGTIAMIFGFASMVGAACLAAAITILRDRISCIAQSPSLSRCCLFCCCAGCAAGAYPIGILGGVTMVAAAMSSLLAHYKEAAPAVTSDNWAAFCTDCLEWNSIPLQVFFLVLFVASDVGVFVFGWTNGIMFATEASLADRTQLDPTSWAAAEGFGTVISYNMAVLFIFALFGLQKFILDRAAANPNCCNTAIAFFVNPSAQIFLHTVISISLVVCVFLHMIANFSAYENSGPYRSYMNIFGMVPLVTGMVAFLLLTLIMAGAHKDIKRNLERLFRSTHILSVFLVILLIFHGPNGLGRHFWMWIAAPLALYLVDVLFRAGWISNSDR